MPLQQKMKPLSFPLRWESTGDQWWYASPIDCAAANGHYDLVRELLYIDANLLIKLTSLRRIRRLETVWEDNDNQVAKSRAYVAKNLLLECETESGHNSLIRAGYGGWLLYTAASAGDLSFVQDLLERDPFLVFGEGEYGITDILYAAARSKSSEVFKVLMEFAVGMRRFDGGNGKVGDEGEVFDGFRLEMVNRGLHSAARGGNLEVLKELLLRFPDVLAFRDAQGSTILHSAAARGHDIVVKDLIASFSIIDSTDHQGNTSLHIAAYRGFLPVVETLLAASPSLASSTNNSGNTFLHMAVFGFQSPGFHRLDHQLELIRKLVTSKMIIVQDIINSRNNQGKTAFHLAAAENINLDVIELLMTVPSIDLKIKDFDGKTPIDILKHHPHSRSSRLLINHMISAPGTVSYREDHAAVVSHFKMQGGLGHSPGTSFRVADSEMFLYATNEDNDNDSDVESVGHSESSGEIISQCNSCALSGIITNSRKPKNSSSLNLKMLLQLPKRKNKESYDETPTSLRQRYSKSSSSLADNKKAIASPISCEFPSPIAKKKFATSLSQGVLSQPRQNISSANSPACSKSSSPCSSDKSFDVSSGGKPIKPLNRGRSFFSKKSRVNRYLCFGAQGLPPVKDSVSCKRDSAGFLMPDSTTQVS